MTLVPSVNPSSPPESLLLDEATFDVELNTQAAELLSSNTISLDASMLTTSESDASLTTMSMESDLQANNPAIANPTSSDSDAPVNLFRGFSVDEPENKSTYEPRPDASLPTDGATNPDAYQQKFDAFFKYINQYPTDSDATLNLLGYVNNLAQASLLVTKMKKELVDKILEATNKAASRADFKGYNGQSGQEGKTNFLNDALRSLKPVQGKTAGAETIHQTLLGLRVQIASAANVSANNAATTRGLGATNPSPKMGGSRDPSAPLPSPNLPPSGAPAPYNFPPGDATQDRKGALDYLSKLLDYLHDHAGDPVALQNLMQFIAGETMRNHGAIPSDIMALLDDGSSKGAGAINAIDTAMTQLAEYAFFAGYIGQNGETVNGEAGMTQYISDTLAELRSLPSNKYTQEMISQLQTLQDPNHVAQFTADHTAPNGDLIWKYTIQDGNLPIYKIYDWTNPNANTDPGDPYNDQFYISQIINSQGGAAPNSFYSGLDSSIDQTQRDYRVTALEQLLKEFKDPLIAITLWIMGAYDDHFQSQQSGLNETTDILTMMTNSIATRLTTLAQYIGFNADGTPKMSGDQAVDFLNTLFNGTTLMNAQFQLSGLTSDWNTNVFQAIANIQISIDSVTIGLLFNNPAYPPSTIAELLCDLNRTPTTAPTPSPNQGYQQLTSILQQAGSYITGTSKTTSMELQTSTSTSSQLIKTWATMLQDLGQWIIKIIANFKASG